MKQRAFHIDEAAANALNAAYLHCTDANTKTRYQAVRLYGRGYSTAQVQDICGCSRSSLMNWTRAYTQHGITALVDARKGDNRARLSSEQVEAVQNQLHRYTPAQLLGKDKCVGDGQFWCIPDLAVWLARDYQVVYQSTTSLRTLLAKCEMSYQRPAKQYKSHSDHKVMDFEEHLEKKILDVALDAPNTVIVAGDEAGLYLQATLRRVWSKKGHTPRVAVSASRDNTHFYGALNLATGHETVLRSPLMNSEVSALFLQKLLAAYPDVPLLLLWDRAPWHKGCAVKAVLAANARLEIMWFPPGCPELNPQEQVWKATREAVSHNHQCARLAMVADAFEKHLQTTEFPCSLLEQHNFITLCTMFN